MAFVIMINVSDSRDEAYSSQPKLLLEAVLGEEVYETVSDCNAASGLAFYTWLYRNVSNWDPSNVSQRIVDGCIVHMHSGKATMRRSGTVDLMLQFYAKEKTEDGEPILEQVESDDE
jgi:hypothetical protein